MYSKKFTSNQNTKRFIELLLVNNQVMSVRVSREQSDSGCIEK